LEPENEKKPEGAGVDQFAPPEDMNDLTDVLYQSD